MPTAIAEKKKTTRARKATRSVLREIKKIMDRAHKQLLLHVTEVDWEYETKRIIECLRETGASMAYIDLFCGAGGTSSGIEKAYYMGQKIANIILGINHDKVAIQSHLANHPNTLHLVEDVRKVNLVPIAKLVEAIRQELPYIKIVLWASAECTNFSKAKGGETRNADSRSLPEELYRYIQAFRPDLIQIENVSEFRIWGPIIQKNLNQIWDKKHKKYNLLKGKDRVDVTAYANKIKHPELGMLYRPDKHKNWYTRNGLGYSKNKESNKLEPIMVPDKRFLRIYFNDWKEHIQGLGYVNYDDRDINSADHGAFTSRTRYFGQFSLELPLQWPAATYAKNPDKLDISAYGKLKPYKAVREVLELDDTGESIFDPNRKKAITSGETFKRVKKGCLKFVPGAQEIWDEYQRSNYVKPPDGDPSEKVNVQFMQSYHAGQGRDEERVYSLDEPNRVVDTQNRYAITDVIPFIVQYNNNTGPQDVANPLPPILTEQKFYLGSIKFMHQHYSGDPSGMVSSIDGPGRAVTCTGGNQSIVDIEQIIPFISMYYSNGHNCHSVNDPSPTIPAADNSALVQPQKFILRQFGQGGGQLSDINNPVGGIMTTPKLQLCTTEGQHWILDTNFNNVGSSIKDPAHTLLASRHHPYLMSHHFADGTSSVDKAAPTVIASQDKKPMHLVQVEMANGEKYFGIAIYQKDSKEVRELKTLMALCGIKDIRMRMLKVSELLRIQGFPPGYVLKGTQTDQKKFIGNSVEVTTAMKLAECYGPYLADEAQKRLAV